MQLRRNHLQLDPATEINFRRYTKILHFLNYLKPWEVVGASDASLQIQSLARNFLGCEFTSIWYPAGWFRVRLDSTLLLERLEVFNLGRLSWILDPLNDLSHGHKVHIFVVLENLVHPEEESLKELGVVLEPSGMEVH